MGFKPIEQEELEKRLASNLLGNPLTTISVSKIDEEEQIEQEKISKLIGKGSNVFLLQEEAVNIHKKNNADTENISGTGQISIINPSEKDRLWDIGLNIQDVGLFEIDSEKEINLGNLEPKSHQKINYNIIDPHNISEPVKITEEIKINTPELESIILDEEDFQRFESNEVEDELDDEFIFEKVQDHNIQDALINIITLIDSRIKEKIDKIDALAGTERKLIRRLLQKKSKSVVKEFKELINDYTKIKLNGRANFLENALDHSIFDLKDEDLPDLEELEQKSSGSLSGQLTQEEIVLPKDLQKSREKIENEKRKLQKKIEKLEKQQNKSKNLDGEIKKFNDQKLSAEKRKESEIKRLEKIKQEDKNLSNDENKKLNDLRKQETEFSDQEKSLNNQLEELTTREKAIQQKAIALKKKEKEIQDNEKKSLANKEKLQKQKEELETIINSKLELKFSEMEGDEEEVEAESKRKPMKVAEIQSELQKVPNLQDNETKILIESLKKLGYLKQQKILQKFMESKIKENEIKEKMTELEEKIKEINDNEEKLKKDQIKLDVDQKKLNKDQDLLQKEKEVCLNAFNSLKEPKEKVKEQIKKTLETQSARLQEIKQVENSVIKITEEINRLDDNIKGQNEKVLKQNEKLQTQEDEINTINNDLSKFENKIEDQIEAITRKHKLKQDEEKRKQQKRITKERSKIIINWSKKLILQFLQGKIIDLEQELLKFKEEITILGQDDKLKFLQEWLENIKILNEENKKFHLALVNRLRAESDLIEELQDNPAVSNYFDIIEDLIPKKIKMKKEIKQLLDKPKETKHFLLLGKENSILYNISIENTSSSSEIKDIHFAKQFLKDFYDIKIKSSLKSDIKLDLNKLGWYIIKLDPQEKAELQITLKFKPTVKQLIGSGDNELSFIQEDILLSGSDITNFSAYSHAIHVIKKKEMEENPNSWLCSFFLKNNSDFNMNLLSILVMDRNKDKIYTNLEFLSKESNMIPPGGNYQTDFWELENETEPQFSRKVKYSVTHETKKLTKYHIFTEQNYFDIVDIQFEKSFSEKEIKSFEESEFINSIYIKNTGNVPINSLIIKEIIPSDFLPPLDYSEFQLRLSSGNIFDNILNVHISPRDEIYSNKHNVEILINLVNYQSEFSINPNEFMEINYKIKAIKPNYKKSYQFPLELIGFYSASSTSKMFKQLKMNLSETNLPKLKVSHQRRNIEIGKEIYPGRSIDEFAISILIKNNSDLKANDVQISDTIPNAFEIVSSNIGHETDESDQDNCYLISFNIESVLPYEEKEIRYYIRNISGEKFEYKELESFIIS